MIVDANEKGDSMRQLATFNFRPTYSPCNQVRWLRHDVISLSQPARPVFNECMHRPGIRTHLMSFFQLYVWRPSVTPLVCLEQRIEITHWEEKRGLPLFHITMNLKCHPKTHVKNSDIHLHPGKTNLRLSDWPKTAVGILA